MFFTSYISMQNQKGYPPPPSPLRSPSLVPPLPLKQPPEDPRDLKTRRASWPPLCPRSPTSTTRTTTPPTSTPATRWPQSSQQLELRRQFLCSRRGKERRLGQTRVKANKQDPVLDCTSSLLTPVVLSPIHQALTCTKFGGG